MKELDKLLLRQLKRFGLEGLDRAPNLEEWKGFLERVSDHYQATGEDRTLLTRSLDLSTAEMNHLKERVENERDRLQAILAAIAEAISAMGQAHVRAGKPGEETGSTHITSAKSLFANRIQSIFAEGSATAEESGRVRVIETGFFRLADQVESMLREMTVTASLKKEMEVARTVQQMLLPAKDTFEKPGLEMAAWCQQAQECGGDWWTVQEQADGKCLLVVGDVTGHGISSALLTGTAKAAVDLAHLVTKGKVVPSTALHLMNHAVYAAGNQKVMMTATAALVDPVERTLTLSNAGHVFPFLVRGGAVQPLVAHGQPLGAGDCATYQSFTVKLEAGDLLVWFTDGVTERENESGEPFTEKRLRAGCQRAAALGVREVRDELVRSVLTFAGNHPADDDMTLVIARVS